MSKPKITVIIPAYNEEKSIGKVVSDIPRNLVEHVIVVNNNSNDNTVEVAESAGAIVLDETRRGYGWACLKGIEKSRELNTDIVVFMDGDYSDYPEEISNVIKSNDSYESTYGLMGGKPGVALFLFYYSKLTNKKEYSKTQETLRRSCGTLGQNGHLTHLAGHYHRAHHHQTRSAGPQADKNHRSLLSMDLQA